MHLLKEWNQVFPLFNELFNGRESNLIMTLSISPSALDLWVFTYACMSSSLYDADKPVATVEKLAVLK